MTVPRRLPDPAVAPKRRTEPMPSLPTHAIDGLSLPREIRDLGTR